MRRHDKTVAMLKANMLFEQRCNKILNEESRKKVYKAALKGSYPAVIVVIENGKVIHQEPVSTPAVAPAAFNVLQEKYPKAILNLEDNTGKILYQK